ncbi:MAG: hypothetical protein K2Z81_04805, partial [Cyanobacteria bacterium]|nr:hypothetical protein [Cyanobacteriota bacterium]
QDGNNNAYCQDSRLSWTDWNCDEMDLEFLDFIRQLAVIRKSQPVLQRKSFFRGRLEGGVIRRDVIWLDENSSEMRMSDWTPDRRHLGVIFDGDALDEIDEDGSPVKGNSLLILFNAYWEDMEFVLPPKKDEPYEKTQTFASNNLCWKLLIETSGSLSPSCWEWRARFPLFARSMAVFELTVKDENLPFGS